MRAKDVLGKYGEQLAADHLSKTGLEIIARNWRCADGEIDIISAREKRALCIHRGQDAFDHCFR